MIMNEETYGALKRIVKEVEGKRKADCPMKDCIVNHMIGGNDIDLVKTWINGEEEEEMDCLHNFQDEICKTCGYVRVADKSDNEFQNLSNDELVEAHEKKWDSIASEIPDEKLSVLSELLEVERETTRRDGL